MANRRNVRQTEWELPSPSVANTNANSTITGCNVGGTATGGDVNNGCNWYLDVVGKPASGSCSPTVPAGTAVRDRLEQRIAGLTRVLLPLRRRRQKRTHRIVPIRQRRQKHADRSAPDRLQYVPG